MRNEGRVFTRSELLPHVVGDGVIVVDRNIDVHIRNVRKKLGDARMDAIVTVRGVGYKFESNSVRVTVDSNCSEPASCSSASVSR